MKRFLALFLSALMIVTSVPVSSVTAFAAEKTFVAEENIQEIQEDLSENSEEQEDALLEENDSSEQMQDNMQEETQEDNQEGEQEEQEASEEGITETTDEEEIVEEVKTEVAEATGEPMLAGSETRNIVESGDSNGVTWELDDKGLLTATIGARSDSNIPWSPEIRQKIKTAKITITSNCTNLSRLFYSCDKLESIVFESVDTSNVTDMTEMFCFCCSLVNLDLSIFDTSKVTNMKDMFMMCNSLESLNISGFKTSNVTNMSGMFATCRTLTNIDLSGFSTSNVTNMSRMFSGCSALTTLDLSKFDTSKVTDMNQMFSSILLTELNLTNFNTESVTNLSGMFWDCKNLTNIDLSNFNTAKVTDMSNMFTSCSSLKSLDLSSFDTSKVTDMSEMFYFCKALTEVKVGSEFNTSEVTDMQYMFSWCSDLVSVDVSNFNTSKVTDMSHMFTYCYDLAELDVSKFNTSEVTRMNWMFMDCNSLKTLDISGFNTSKVTDMSYMFAGLYNVEELDLGSFDTSNVTNMSNMFPMCIKLKKINLRSFNTTNVTNMASMFQSCWVLPEIDLRSFDMSNVTNKEDMFKDCNAYVIWNNEKEIYQIVFNANYPEDAEGGRGKMPNESFKFGDTRELYNNTYMCNGYEFDCWNTSADGKGTKYTNMQKVSGLSTLNGGEVTLYAMWKPVLYTVEVGTGNFTVGTTPNPTGTKLNLQHDYPDSLVIYIKPKMGYIIDSVIYYASKDGLTYDKKTIDPVEIDTVNGNKYVFEEKSIISYTYIEPKLNKAQDLSKATIKATFENLDYNGDAKVYKSVDVWLNNKQVPQEEYEIIYLDDHTTAGTHILRVSAKAESKIYSGYKDYAFVIKGIKGGKITDTKVFTIDVDKAVPWAGPNKDTIPNITIKNSEGTPLNKDTDYLVFYSNNIVPGTAKATIVGINGYEGNKTVSYSIPKPSFADSTEEEVAYNLSVSGISDKVYTGTAITQELTINYYDGNKNAIKLEEGTDYTVKYSKNVNAGKASVVITGKGNYTGKVTKNFIIEPVDLGNLPEGTTVKVTAPGVKYVAGKAVKTTPVVELVKDNQVVATLKTGTDYVKLSDKDFTENTSKTTTAKVTITGKGNYKGTATGTYAIADKNLADKNIRVTYKNEIGSVIYPGKPVEPEVVVQIKGDGDTYTDISTSNYYIQYSENNKPGTATVKIIGTGEYYGTKTLKFKITARKVSERTGESGILDKLEINMVDSHEFTGYAITPEVTIKDKGISDDYELVKGKDYTVSYSSNTNEGKATAKITFKGNYSGSISKYFEITSLNLSKVSDDSIEIFNQPYNNGKAVTPVPLIWNGDSKAVNPKALKLTYQDNKNVGTATIIIKGVKEKNVASKKEITFAIEKANLSKAVFSKITDQIYTGKTVAPKFTLTYNKVKLKEGIDYTVEYIKPENSYKGEWTVKVTAKENRNFTGTATSTFIVK